MNAEAIKLSVIARERLYSVSEIAEEIGVMPDTLRSWFRVGGLKLTHHDEASPEGGRAHRLHWRSVAMLLIAMRLNGYGFSKREGEAAGAAGAVFASGIGIEHFETTDSPLIAVSREPGGVTTDEESHAIIIDPGGVRVALIARDAAAGYVEQPLILDGWEGIGTVLIDPIAIGRIIWRMAWRQVMSEIAAGATFDPEEIEAGRRFAAGVIDDDGPAMIEITGIGDGPR